MENASKALIMAGGILIAVLIIGVLVYSFGTMSGYFNAEQDEEAAKQLKIFNDQYESYNRKLLRGTDVISVMNRVLDNNEKYGTTGYDEPNYIINMGFKMKEEMVYKKTKTEDGREIVVGTQDVKFDISTTYDQNDFESIKNNTDAFIDFKRRVFDCTKIEYNEQTGRVNYMEFTERKLKENEYMQGL